ncbi:hypothetical protein [Brevibacillus porteri]|uniref:DUF4179 domain-containing protein n=1 Tax=Brevibacillus porteri TaxID=2126350 RepID=A0ABX5FI82_9BACL|nr:hypothetical protein [Brevibacillus porteri]MED1798514.1 hypothetical protein [Brevibacillus porteri]MED2134368.1 hypothetical protein [Brevibacillus porteri]MED2746770.1 hypothetical protein [Brevibacillus porteri]MED2818058.1 hypothetical protein [Brevibacillus porteri]MED2897643.1 hypothetical protein [Brevibacillus porteri]
MTIERKIREHLHEEAETMECPPAISKRIEQSYSHYLQRKRSEITMKKRLIGGLVAAAILIPTAAFAAPVVIDMLTRAPMTSEQVKLDEVGKATLEKLYAAIPETKSFEIIDASYLGDPNDSTKKVQLSIVLQEKGGTGKKITLHTNGITDEIQDLTQENWEPKEKPLITLPDQEIKAKVDHLIDKLYGNIKDYEAAMEQMDNPNQKTFILNYTKKGSEGEGYQAFVQGNTISLSPLAPAPSNKEVEGFFSLNGKPDYTADYFLNDEKLFSLLKMSPTELKEELAKGKSVVEVAASKNISKQQVIDVIARTQAEGQLQDGKNKVTISDDLLKQMMKEVEPKVVHIIEHKTETEW